MVAVVLWTAILDTLGRQRMLSQAMAKAILSFDAAKNIIEKQKSNVLSMDLYITSMRKLYTKSVVSLANKSDVTISMTPESEEHPAMPYPATFMRMVNEDARNYSEIVVEIISEFPINKQNMLTTVLDMEANEALKKNSNDLYMKAEEIDNKMTLTFYSSDLATDQSCVDCHITSKNLYEVGDLLGIRRYRVPFAETMDEGQPYLNPSLDEYELAKTIFTETLSAVKSGGKYPENLNRENFKEINAIEDQSALNHISNINAIFTSFEKVAATLISRTGGNEETSKLSQLANELLIESHQLVVRYREIAEGTQSSVKWKIAISTVILLLTILVIALYMRRDMAEHTRLEAEVLKKEAQLRRTQKMDAIGQLSGGIAHDFNNILCIIIGNIGLLKFRIGSDEKSKLLLETIRKSADRAVDMTRKLLNFSRMQAVETTSININQSLEGLENMLARSLTPEVEIKYHLSDDLWQTEINSGDFEDSLINLVLNARDSMPNGGLITIETRNCTLNSDFCSQNPESKPGEYIEIAVSDTGQGISIENQQRIFEPFFTTTKDKDKGTGLGLAMVYGFAKRSMGFLKVYSEVDIGTTFKVFLPRSIEQSQIVSSNNTENQILQRGTETLLVVDDEEELQVLVKTQMENLGYQVFTASNANEALTCLANEPSITLLLTDVVMPGGMNGFELAEQAAVQHPELKILLTSGYTGKALQNREHAHFDVNLISKPYSEIELAQRIRELIDISSKAIER